MSSGVSRKLTLAALMLSASILLSRILGFVRDAVIAYFLGAGSETDAYYAGFTLPDLMNYFLAGGTLSITFVPLYSRRLAAGAKEDADHLLSVVATTLGTLLVAMIVLGEIFASWLVPPFFPGFHADELARTTQLTRIVMPAQVFFYLGGLMSAALMAQERFVAVAIAPLVYNLSIIVFGVALVSSLGAAGFSVGALVGAFLGPFLVPLLDLRGRARFRPVWSFRDRGLKDYVKLTLPLMVGVTLLSADEWIGRYLGSKLTEGTITWLNNARRLMLVPMALIGQATGQAALPFLSRLAAERKDRQLGATLTGSLRATLFLAVLSAVFLAVLADPIVTCIYERGRYTASDASLTAAILRMYAPAVVFWSVQVVAARGFYAHRDTWRPMVIGTVVTAVAIPIYVGLSSWLDAPGLGLATSIGVGLFALGTLGVFQRRHGTLDLRSLAGSLAQALVVGCVTGAALWATQAALNAPLSRLSKQQAAWIQVAVGGLVLLLVAVSSTPFLRGAEAAAVRRMARRLGRLIGLRRSDRSDR